MSHEIRRFLEDGEDGEEEEARKITPEEQARFDEFTREINARIAERASARAAAQEEPQDR